MTQEAFVKQFLTNLANVNIDVHDPRQCYFDLISFKNAANMILMNMEGVGGKVDDYKF